MTLIPNLLFILAFAIAQNSALEEINSAVAIKAAKDNPVLLKILQTVDAATSNERLFDVTLKLLKSLCVCMRETIRTKQLEKFQLSREIESLETEDDAREANRKVLDIYLKIYNKTCIDLREELTVKVNTSGCLTPEDENDFLNDSDCGKKAIGENTEDYEKLTSQVTQVVESEANLKKILQTIFVVTRDYHKFHVRKFNLLKNSEKPTQNSVKHSIIVILTFYPQNGTQLSDNITEVSSNELNTTLYSHSPIDIDVIDTGYGRRGNSTYEDFIPKLATNCTLKSIYSFLLQSEEVNKTKVFKMLRKKGTIKVYIDIPTQTNHIDYSKVCCNNETEIPLCKIDFSRESFDSHEITTYLPEFKKRKKPHENYKDTIYKIKTLVQLYDRKLNKNRLNQLNANGTKNNLINKSKSDEVDWTQNKLLKPPFKVNDSHPVAESVIVKNYFKQNATEIFFLLNISSFTESKMNTVPENSYSKELIRTTLHDDKDKLVLQNEDISVTNVRQFNNLVKPYASSKLITETTLPLESGLEEIIRPTYEEDKKTSMFQSYQKPPSSTADHRLTTAYHYYSSQNTLPTHENNEFITETEKKITQSINTTTENLDRDSSGSTTASHTKMIKDNVNVNTNTIDYSDSAEILKRTENYPKQKGHDKNIDEQSVKFINNNQHSNGVKKQNIEGIFNTEINYIDGTNAMTTDRRGGNENFKITSEKSNNEVDDTPTDTNENFNSFDMQENQLKVTGVIKKTLARSHIGNNNLIVKETINSTTDYSNTAELLNMSDIKTLTTSFVGLINNTLKENSIKITVKHDVDGDDLQPLVLFDPGNIQLAKLEQSTSNKMNLQFTKTELFPNSTTPETPFEIFGNDIEKRSSITGKQDQIKTTKNFVITEQYNNILNSFETTDEIKNTNKHAKPSMVDTTESVINFQELQSELENTTLVKKYESDSYKTISILGSSTTKPTVNNIKASFNSTKDADGKYFNQLYVTEVVAAIPKIFNTTSEKYIKTTKFDKLSKANENINEIQQDFVNARIDAVRIINFTGERFTNMMDYKSKYPTRVTNSKKIKIQRWDEIRNLNPTKLNNGLKLSNSSEKDSVPEVNENVITKFGLHKTRIENSKGNDNLKKTDTRPSEGEDSYTTYTYNVTEKNGITNPSKLTRTPNYIWSFDTKLIDDNYDPAAISALEPQRNNEMNETSRTYFPSIEESLSTVTPPIDIAIVDNNIEENTLKDEISQSMEASDIAFNTNDVIRTESNAINKDKLGIGEYFKSGRMRSTNYMQISYKNQSKPYATSFESNTEKPRAENGTNVFTANLKGTTEPYSNNKTYVHNVDDALLESITKNNSDNDKETYTFALSTTSTLNNISKNREIIVQTETKTDLTSSLLSNTKENNTTDSIKLITTSYEMQNNSPFILIEMTKNSYNDKKVSDDLTTAPTLLKSTATIQPHENIDSFPIIAKLKSSTEFSNYSGETENNTEEENKSKNTLEAIGLSSKSPFLTNQSKITAQFSKDKLTTFPTLFGSDTILRPQVDSVSFPTDTPKFNNTTVRPTKILATNNIDHQQISISDNIAQYSSKANKSRITRSTSAMRGPIGTSNQTSTFSTTVPFSDSLSISIFTSTLQELDELNNTKTTQSSEVSDNFDLPSVNTEPQFAVTVDPSFDKTQTGTIGLGTEKYLSIPENDEKITTYIISPTIIRDTDTKKSMADLNNLTNFKVLNVFSNEHYDVKSINNIIQAMIPTDQTNINNPQNFVVQRSQPTRNIDTTEINYSKMDNDAKNHTEIGDTAALRLTTNVPQTETSEINNISFEATNNGKFKETKAVNLETNNIDDSEMRSTVADKTFAVSFEPRFEGPFETQSFKMLNFSDTQNNSRSTSFETTNNGIDSEVPSSIEDIHNDFQTNLKFFNEFSQSDQQLTNTSHNISTTRESQIGDLNMTQLQPVALKYFKENMSKAATISSNQHENTNDTLILTKENTNYIYSPYSSLVIKNSYTTSDITEKLLEMTKEPKYEETDTSHYTSAKPTKFYKSEYVLQLITSILPFSNTDTDDEQSYIRSITRDNNNFTIIISPDFNDNRTKHYSDYTKISSFGENFKVTTPNLIENEHNKELSDSDVEFQFVKENIPFNDVVTSRLKSTEKNSNFKVTTPKITFKPQLNKLQYIEPFKSGENGETINTTNLAGKNKDFTSFRVVTSSKSTKEKKYDRNHISKVVRITNTAGDKYNDKVHNVEVTTPYVTKNHVPQNKNTTNVQLSYTYDTRFEIAEEHTVIYDNVTSNTVKLDDFSQQETFEGAFESITDLDNHKTLKTMNSTKFVDNFVTKPRTLPDNKIADYNFTREILESSSVPERPIFIPHTETLSTTEDGNDVIFNILNSSAVSYKQYNGNDNTLRGTKISPNSSEYYSQMPKAYKSADYVAKRMRDGFEIRKENINNNTSILANITFENMTENEIANDPSKGKLIESLNKAKHSIEFNSTEIFKDDDFKNDIFENNPKITEKSTFHTTQMDESIKTKLAIITERLHSLPITDFSTPVVDKLNELAITSNIIKISKSPKQYTERTNNFAVTELSLAAEYDTITRRPNITSLTDKVQHKNNSFQIKNEIIGNYNTLRNSTVAYLIKNNKHIFFNADEVIFNTAKNETYAPKAPAATEVFTDVNVNPETCDNKVEITKDANIDEAITDKILKTRQFISLENGSNLETLSQAPNHFQVTNSLSYTEDKFEEDDIISNIKKSSIILNQQQADASDEMALKQSASSSLDREFYIETQNTRSTPSKDRVKRTNETFRIAKDLTKNIKILKPIDVTVGAYLTDNKFHETTSKELVITNIDRPKTLNEFESIKLIDNSNTKPSTLSNYLEITEAPSFDVTLTGEILRTTYHSLSRNGTEFTNPNEKKFLNHATDTSKYTEYVDSAIILNEKKPSNFTFGHNLSITDLYSAQYQNGTINTLPTLRDIDNSRKTKETTASYTVVGSNDAIVGHLSENEIPHISDLDFNIDEYKHQSLSEQTQVENNLDRQLDILDIPLEATKETNIDETQTVDIIKSLTSENHKTTDYFTEATASTKSFKAVKNTEIQDKSHNLKPRSKEDTVYSTNLFTSTTLEDKNEDSIKTHSSSEQKNMNEISSFEKIPQFNDKFITMKDSDEIKNDASSQNETVNEMAENEIHEASSNLFLTTDLNETYTHKSLELAVLTNDVGDRPNITDKHKITTIPSFGKLQAVSLLPNLKSFQFLTESTRLSKKINDYENKTPTERQFMLVNEESITLNEKEHLEKTYNTENTSSTQALKSKFSEELSYAITESSDEPMKGNSVSTNTIAHFNSEITSKKKNASSSSVVIPRNILVQNLVENEMHSKLNNALHTTEFIESETLKEKKSDQKSDNINTRFNTADQNLSVTEITISKNATTVDFRNNEAKIMTKTDVSQENSTEFNFEESSTFPYETYNYSNSTECHNDTLKTKNYTNVKDIIAFTETVLIPKATDSTGIIGDHITFTVTPVLNETQIVEILNAEEHYSQQNETKFLTPYDIQNFVVSSDSLNLNKDNIEKGFNILNNTSNYYDGLSKQNTTKSNLMNLRAESGIVKESIESSTDMPAIIETATASFDHLLDDFTFPGVTNVDKVTDVRFSRENQTSQITTAADKKYGHSETATENSTTTVSPLQDNILENKPIKIKDDHEIIIQFNATEEPKEREYDDENIIKSIIQTEQNTATTADSYFIKRGVINPQLNGTPNGMSMTTVNQSTKMHQYESSDILLSSVTSNQLDLSKSNNLQFYENSHLKTAPDKILTIKDNEIDGTYIKSYNTAVNAELDSNLRLINKSKMTMNKNPTTAYGLDINTKPEKKINIDENLIPSTTKTVMSEANITTTVNELKILELLNKIRSSYYEGPNHLNEMMHSVENDYFTVTTPLGETDSYLNNTELIHKGSKNVDDNEITDTTLHENLPFSTADLTNQLQSKTMKSTQHNEIDLKDKDFIANDAEVNTTETTECLTSLSGANFSDKNLSEIHDYTYPISLNMLGYNDTTEYNNIFEETTESTLLSIDTIIKQTQSNNEFITFDQTQTKENSNYENTEKPNTNLEISQDSYVSKTNMLNSLQSESVSQSSHLREKTDSPIDLHTAYPQKRNETEVTGHSKKNMEREVTELVTTYTEQNGEGQLQNSAEMNVSVTEVESNLITLTPRTTSKKISLGDVTTKVRTETTKQLEKDLNDFVTNPTTVPFLKENLKVIAHVEGLEGTSVIENEIDVSKVTNRVNSFSTPSMTIENIITKSNTVDNLALPHNKTSATHGSSVLINVPPLALHVSDLKFELMPTYGANNTSQIIPNLHGTFNISLKFNSQNVTDPMGLNKTIDVFNKTIAFGDQLQPIKRRVNSTSEKPELNKYKENAYTKVINHYLPSITKNKKEFLSYSTSDASESQTPTNFLEKDYTLWDDGQNITIKRKDMSTKFTTPEIEKYLDFVQVTALGEQKEKTLLQLNTNQNYHLRIPPSSLHQDSVTEPYSLNTNFQESNNLKDAREFHDNTMSDSTNQIDHYYNDFYSNKAETKNLTKDSNHDKINRINLTRNAVTPTTIKNIETGLTNNESQLSPSRRFGNETGNLFLKPNKDVDVAENKYTHKNISNNRRIIDSNIVLTTVESEFYITDMNTTLRSIYTENNSSNLTTTKDDKKHSSYLVPAISGLSHNTIKITKKGNISESSSTNHNNTSAMNVHSKTTAQNFANDKNSSIEPTTPNTVQLLESNPNIISVIDANKPNSPLVPVTTELLQNDNGMTIVDVENLSESAIANQNKSPFVYESHKKDAQNSTNIIQSSMETTTYQSQSLEPKPKVTNIIDGSKPSSILLYVDTMTSTDKVNFSVSAMPNQNTALAVNAFSKTNVQTPATKKENSLQTTTNKSQIMKSISNVTGNKTSSNLFTLISEPLLNATKMKITKNENFSKSAILNENKTLFVNIHNVINVQNYAEMKKDSIKMTSNTTQLPEMKTNTFTPIVLNVVLIADKINKKNRKRKNAKSKQNKTVKILEEISTGKVGMSTTKNIKLKSEDEKSSNNSNKAKDFPIIRKAYEAITTPESSTERNTDPSIMKQKTDTLTTVNLNIEYAQTSQNFNINDKYSHRKQPNHVPKLLQSIDNKKESNVINKFAITDKTEHSSDSKLKYESFNTNQHVAVTSKSLFRTTKQIKYNTYRPLSEEELVPSELDKIISLFPKYYTKKTKIKNPQQVKNYHDAPYLNNIKHITKPDSHNTSNIYDPLDKKNTYPIKKLISSPRKVIKRIKLPNKRNEIMTMNTADFFSRRLGVTKNDKIGDILKLYPKPVLQLLPVTTKPRIVVLRPKFNSFNTLTQKPAIKKPILMQHDDIDYYRNLHRSNPQYRRSGSIWNDVNNNMPGNLGTLSRTGFGDPVIDTPYYIPTIMKPKFLRDRVNSIRSYIYNADKKPNYRRHFMNEPDEVDDADDSLVTYSKGNSRDEEDTVEPVHRISRPKKTIFFLSPTVPYNHYF